MHILALFNKSTWKACMTVQFSFGCCRVQMSVRCKCYKCAKKTITKNDCCLNKKYKSFTIILSSNRYRTTFNKSYGPMRIECHVCQQALWILFNQSCQLQTKTYRTNAIRKTKIHCAFMTCSFRIRRTTFSIPLCLFSI